MFSHLPEIVAIAVAGHALAVAIVNLTPTPKDDEALDSVARVGVKLYRVIEILAGIITPLAKR
jgi:hypothetical protein